MNWLRKGIFWDGNDILVCRLIGGAIGTWLFFGDKL